MARLGKPSIAGRSGTRARGGALAIGEPPDARLPGFGRPGSVRAACPRLRRRAAVDGRAWTATELSAAADVAPSTASGHLARLVEGQLITCLSQGRHRYYRLAGHDVAALVEQMMGLSWSRITPPETSAPMNQRR